MILVCVNERDLDPPLSWDSWGQTPGPVRVLNLPFKRSLKLLLNPRLLTWEESEFCAATAPSAAHREEPNPDFGL